MITGMQIETTCRPNGRRYRVRGRVPRVTHVEHEKRGKSVFGRVTRVAGELNGVESFEKARTEGARRGEITSATAPVVLPRIYDSFGSALRMITHAY